MPPLIETGIIYDIPPVDEQQDKPTSATSDEYQGSSDVTGDDLVQQLWPGAEIAQNVAIDKRKFELKPSELEYAKSIYRNVMPDVVSELEMAETSEDIIRHLKKVDGLFRGKWGDNSVVGGGFSYDNYPEESWQCRYLMNEAFLPTLDKLEKIALNKSIDNLETVEDLERYIYENYEYDAWFFGRASEITNSMLNIGGLEALPSIRKASEYITNIENHPDYEYWADEGFEEESTAEVHYYNDPAYLEFAEPEHFGFHSSVVQSIADYPWDENDKPIVSRFLAGYLDVNSLGSLGKYVDAFENLGVENSVPLLLGKLKDDNVLSRRMSAEILFRLELGKIGVTEEGVDYLGKLYDLGKYNDPDFFVRRLNNSGLMAILEEEGGNIEGVFPLNLHAEEDVVQAEIRQLVSQELFLPKADETSEQRQQREQYLQLFLENYENIFNDDFFENTGVKLNSLDLHEQGWFLLSYLNLAEQENGEGLEHLKTFVREYGEYGLKSFLSLEYGGSGQEILDFTETTELTKEEKSAIFKNFYGIANEALNWREVFGRIDVDAKFGFAAQVHEALIRKNAEFFKAAQIIAKGEGQGISMGELLDSMSSVREALSVLRGFYQDGSKLELDGSRDNNPDIASEYMDATHEEKAEGARQTWYFNDPETGDKIKVLIRPESTYTKGLTGARINFEVNLRNGNDVRIAFDVSHYHELMDEEDAEPVVSLDLGVKYGNRKNPRFSTQNVGNVLDIVPESEGGHNEASFAGVTPDNFKEISYGFISYLKSRYLS